MRSPKGVQFAGGVLYAALADSRYHAECFVFAPVGRYFFGSMKKADAQRAAGIYEAKGQGDATPRVAGWTTYPDGPVFYPTTPQPRSHPMPTLIDHKMIRTDLGTQIRLETNAATVKEYSDDMERWDTFPPIVVFYDGDHYILADGFHRLAAHKVARPNDRIMAEVKSGTLEDAQWEAICANTANSLRRTNADKRNAFSCSPLLPTWLLLTLSAASVGRGHCRTMPDISCLSESDQREWCL